MLYKTGASTAHVEPIRWRKRMKCPFNATNIFTFLLIADDFTLLYFTLLYFAAIICALHLVLDIIIFPEITNDWESNFGEMSN